MTPCPSIVPKHNILVTWRALGPQRGGLGLQPAPTRKQESPGAPPFQALAGGQLLGLGSSPSPPLVLGRPPAPPLPALSSGRACPSFIFLQHWVMWQTPCFRDPRRYPWLQGLCVGSGMWGEGLGRGAGEDIPHQESQRQGRALPQEPPLCPSTPPCPAPRAACCFSFSPCCPALL